MSLLTSTPAEQQVQQLLNQGTQADSVTRTLADALAKATSEARSLLGKERLARLTELASVAQKEEA